MPHELSRVSDAMLRAIRDDAKMDTENDPMELDLFPIGAFRVLSITDELLAARAILRDVAARGIEHYDHRPFGMIHICRECEAESSSVDDTGIAKTARLAARRNSWATRGRSRSER